MVILCYCMYVPRFVGFGALLVPPVWYVDSCIEQTSSCFCCNPEKHMKYTPCVLLLEEESFLYTIPLGTCKVDKLAKQGIIK